MKIVENIKLIIERIRHFLSVEIWQANLQEFSRKKTIALRQARIAVITTKNFGENNLGWQSVALSYFSTMCFVPMIAIIFTITNGFGLGEYLRELVFNISTQDALVERIFGYADNIIILARSGPYGLISFGLFVWGIIWLLLCIERAFNNIWKVENSRKLYKKIISYTSIMLIAPFVILVFLSMTIALSSGADFIREAVPALDEISDILVWLVLYAITIIIFTCIYKFIPNTKVQIKPAFVSAVLTGLVFIILQYLYLETQYMVSKLNAVYGIFAAVPLFMIWLNFGWTIILTGASISYAFQNEGKYIKPSIKK